MTKDKPSLQNLIEQLAELIVLSNHKDYKGLADAHTLLQQIEEAIDEADHADVAKPLTTAVCGRVEDIILEKAEDQEKEFNLVARGITALQSIVLEGDPPAAVDIPQEFGLQHKEEESGGGFTLPAHVDEDIMREFLERQPGVLDEIEEDILEIEKESSKANVGSLKRKIHTLKGEAGLLGLADVERLCHVAEDAIQEVKPKDITDLMLEAKDWLELAISYYSGEGSQPDAPSGLIRKFEQVISGEEPAEEKPASEEAEDETETTEESATEAETAEEDEEELGEPEEIVLEADRELLSEFVSESMEHLENADLHLLTLETEPENEEALNAVFRAFHTIKGVAGFMMLTEIGQLAHEAENLLDKARKGEITLVDGAMDITFDSVDKLKQLVEDLGRALSSGVNPMSDPTVKLLCSRLKKVIAGDIDAGKSLGSQEPASDNVGEILQERGLATKSEVDRALEGQKLIEQAKKKIGEILVEGNETSTLKIEKALAQQDAELGKKMGEILVEQGIVTQASVDRALEKQKEPTKTKVGQVLVKNKSVAAKDVVKAIRSQKAGAAPMQRVAVKETVKVEADRLDRLLDLIGELVIAESMVTQSKEISQNISSDFSRQIRHLDKITRELQEMSTSLRMVPIRPVFQKMARLVRDLGRKSGKQVEFVSTGEDTELDKTVVDQIGDPLVHMVRNAVDHGIEASAQDRVNAGKTAHGTVQLRAFHKGGSIYIEIEDDGKGLDKEAILKKAIERGVVKENDQLTDREVHNLIFEAGFSTAKKVTDVSGRGVGMDVVRKNIEKLRGQVEIRSEKGKGSVFTLRLPLTLAIIDGMVIIVGQERYIVPTLTVVRSVKPTREDVETVLGKGEMLKMQGELLPLFRLNRLFGVNKGDEKIEDCIVLVVEDDGKQIGLLVDELLGQQQIVIKSLGSTLKDIQGISGGAIMPDGRVGLIVDVGGLVKIVAAGEDVEEVYNRELDVESLV